MHRCLIRRLVFVIKKLEVSFIAQKQPANLWLLFFVGIPIEAAGKPKGILTLPKNAAGKMGLVLFIHGDGAIPRLITLAGYMNQLENFSRV